MWLRCTHDLTNEVSVLRSILPVSYQHTLDGSIDRLVRSSFRLKLNEDAMATEKLAEGIASFSQAIVKVEKIITNKIQAASS